MEVKLDLERELLPEEGGPVVLAVRCGSTGAEGGRAPLSISAVLDRSTSMRGAKLEALKKSARKLVDTLGPRDRLALVAFASRAQVIAAGPAEGRESFLDAIDSLSLENGTNLALALEKAGEVLKADASANAKRVLLLTDGGANAGVTERPALAAIARELRDREILTTTLGFGLEYDEETLSAIAGAGGGRLYHVNGPAKLEQAYSRELGGLRSIVGRSVEVTISPEGGARVLGSRNAYPAYRKGGALVVSLSELRGDETKVVLLDLSIPAVSRGTTEARVALLTVTWTTAEGATRSSEHPVFLRFADARTAAKAEPNGEVLAEIVLLDAAVLKERALADDEAGDNEAGSKRLSNSLVHLSPGTAKVSPALDAELKRLAALAERLAKGRLDPDLRKALRSEVHEASYTVRGRLDVGDGPPI
ncbi:VWA domain-containing protein [bacterium]|nr:VWA domain-containing protein [bacterium]